MKKINELYKTLENTLIYDAIVAFILFIISEVFFKNYILYELLGLLLAAINFAISAFALDLFLIKKVSKYSFIVTLSYFIKALIVAIVGAVLYKQNIYYLYAYLVGFLSHFIAMLLLGIKLKAD